jgi:hypothetical protein
MIATVQVGGAPLPKSTILLALNARCLCPRRNRFLSLRLSQLTKSNRDRHFGLDFLRDAAIDRVEVHRCRIKFPVVLTDVRESLREDVGCELADAELTDLLSPLRKLTEPPLVADADKPVLFESLDSHSDAVIDDDDRRILFVQIGREKNLHSARAGVERVRNQLLDRFVRAGIQTLGEKLDDAVAETHVDLVRLIATSTFLGAENSVPRYFHNLR